MMKNALWRGTEVVREPAQVGGRRHFDLLPAAPASSWHAQDDIEREDPCIVRRPAGQVGGHMPEGSADFEHAAARTAQEREHSSSVILAGIAAKRAREIVCAERGDGVSRGSWSRLGSELGNGCHV